MVMSDKMKQTNCFQLQGMDERHPRNHAVSHTHLLPTFRKELRAIIKNEIPKLLSKSESIDIHLICEQNWIKCDGTFELELIEWVSRIPIVIKIRSDYKRPVYANRYFM
uniref:Uncharacterized protein n=1 Tax=Romanomermis culicivorax TaxID=13658 RepID=A0A915JUQ9_ROMCU